MNELKPKPMPESRSKSKKGSHDPETTVRAGMSPEGTGVDSAETLASTGDAESAFEQIAAGTATGLGIDRGEATGTGGLASEEDRDEVAEGDSWRQHFERDPFSEDQSAERFEASGGRPGWRTAGGLEGEDPEWLEAEPGDEDPEE